MFNDLIYLWYAMSENSHKEIIYSWCPLRPSPIPLFLQKGSEATTSGLSLMFRYSRRYYLQKGVVKSHYALCTPAREMFKIFFIAKGAYILVLAREFI